MGIFVKWWLHGINSDGGCYSSVKIDKSVVVFNRFLKRLFITTTINAAEIHELSESARGIVAEDCDDCFYCLFHVLVFLSFCQLLDFRNRIVF